MPKNRTVPFFSVVIPVYKRQELIKKSVSSVLTQSFGDFELIVVDDGSDDGTSDSVKRFNDERLKYVRQKNSGPASARNRGIKESRGNFISFLDSDDWWLENKLEETERAVKENPGYMIYHTQERWYRNGDILNQKKRHTKPCGYVFKKCLKLCCISISAAVVKRELFDKIGFFDENLPACEDYDFWLRASAIEPVYLIDKVLTEKEGGHGGRLSMQSGLDRYRVLSIKKILENGSLTQRQKKEAFEELKIKCKIYANGCFKRGRKKEGEKYLSIAGGLNEKIFK